MFKEFKKGYIGCYHFYSHFYYRTLTKICSEWTFNSVNVLWWINYVLQTLFLPDIFYLKASTKTVLRDYQPSRCISQAQG